MRTEQEEINRLEKHKMSPAREINQILDMEVSKLKLIEATQATRVIMFSKQRLFEYWDKPSTFLAKILSDKYTKTSMPTHLSSRDGAMVDGAQDKLQVFCRLLVPNWKWRIFPLSWAKLLYPR